MVGQPFTLKTTPPRSHRLALARPRLERFWRDAEDCGAILVEAPRGFGKTTALAQWRRLWLERGALVAWITLDADDDPASFNESLLFALRAASGRSVFDTLLAQSRARSEGDLETLTAILSEVANLATPTVLMLDDAERLPRATVESSLAYLVLNAPANLQVVIGSRVAPSLPTAELVARNGLRRLGVHELRLDLDETVAILRTRFGSRVSLDDCVKLHEITEGWPIGLQLAAASIERDPDLAHAIRSLSGRTNDIERYFVESLFDRLPPEQRDFLVRISILDYLTPELCEYVTGQSSAARFIDQLMADTPIVIVAELHGWIRLHRLARDFLLARFEALPAAERRQLHLRAADWYDRSGLFHEAGAHALAAGDEARAAAFAEQAIWNLAVSGRLGEARQWLRHLPQPMVAGDIALRISSAWVMALGDRPAEALEIAEAMAAEPGHSRQSRFLIALVYVCAAGFCDKPGFMQKALAPWIESPGDVGERAYAQSFANSKAAIALFSGATEQARRIFAMAPALGQGGANDLARTLADALIAFSHLWDGNAFKAESCLQLPLAAAEREVGRRSTHATLLAVTLAAAQLERGNDEAARSLLAHRIDVIERLRLTDAWILAYRTAAYLAWRSGDERRAIEALDHLRATGTEQGVPRMVMAGLAEQVRIHALAARPETAREKLATLEGLRSAFRREEFAPFLPLYDLTVAIARAYASLASNDINGANDALKRADSLAAKTGRGRDTIVVKVLRAIAADAQGYADRAAALLIEASGLAAIGGLARVVADTHPRAAQLLDGEQVTAAPVRDRVELPAAERRAAAVVGGLLTPKEAKILGLLCANMSNKLIARSMDISDETVKWHLKNLYSKLSAGTRKHAVDRARLLGLISA